MKRTTMKLVVALAILLITGFSQQAFAQPQGATLHTISISFDQYTALQTGSAPVYAIANPAGSATDFTATFTPTPGGGTDFPCEEELTEEVSAQMQALANHLCQKVRGCYLTADCAYMLVEWTPDPVLCGKATNQAYQQVMDVYGY